MTAPPRGLATILARADGPAYQQIAGIMRGRILSGEFAVGAQLPTEDAIMERFGVSRHTVRAAVQMLAADDLIDRFPGRGTFVKDRASESGTWAVRSLDEMLEHGFQGATKVIDIRTIDARTAPEAAISLRLDADDRLFRVRLQRVEDGNPLTYAVIDLPLAIARQLPKDLAPRLESRQLLHIVEQATGIRVAKVRQIATASAAKAEAAKRLGVKPGTALLLLRNIFLDAAGQPVETSAILCNPARYRHVIELDRSR